VLSDKNLRLAIGYALDNEQIAAAGLNLSAARTFGTPKFSDYNAAKENDSNYMTVYDTAKAKEYLSQTNYNGTQLKLLCINNESSKNMATMIMAFLLNVGIETEINATDSNLLFNDSTNPDAWDLCIMNVGGGFTVGAFNRLVNNQEWGTGKAFGFIDDPQLQRLLDTGKTIDGHTQPNVTAFTDYILDNAYYYQLNYITNAVVYSSKITEIGPMYDMTLMINASKFD
jgi:ABC-type transport system substrate-binding protein